MGGKYFFKLGTPLSEQLAQLQAMTIETPTGCRELVGWTNYSEGYPYLGHSGKSCRIARWILIDRGIDMVGKASRHTCDNKACINRGHIIPGTHADNIHDMRMRSPKPKRQHVTYSTLKGATWHKHCGKWYASGSTGNWVANSNSRS